MRESTLFEQSAQKSADQSDL